MDILAIFFGFLVGLIGFGILVGSINVDNPSAESFLGVACGTILIVTGAVAFFWGLIRNHKSHTHHRAQPAPPSAAPGPDIRSTVRPLSAAPTQRHLRAPRFYYQVGGVTLGPVDNAGLQRLADEGTVDVDTYIRPETSDEWRRLEEMME